MNNGALPLLRSLLLLIKKQIENVEFFIAKVLIKLHPVSFKKNM